MQMRRALALGAALVLGGTTAARAQASLLAIWGSGPTDIWVAGDARAALHYDGRAWNEVPFGVPLSGSINALWGSGPNDVFAAGDGGMILRWNGQAWTRMGVPTDRQIVAIAGRSATDAYALVQSYNDREPPTLLRWDGRAWTATPLSLPFRANALVLQGADVLVAGMLMNDPTPGERRTRGVLARLRAGQWTFSGWNGQAVTDAVLAGAGWSRIFVNGSTVLVAGERDDGSKVMAMHSGGAWTLLPPAVSAMSGQSIQMAFLAADGVPVALNDGPGLSRYTGGRWAPVTPPNPMAMAMQQAQQMQQPQNMQQMQQLAQAMQNPMMLGVQMAAFDMSYAEAAWGPSSNDFYVVTSTGRIVRVQGTSAAFVYDASCSDPMQASMNPICQMIMQQQANPQQTGQPPAAAPRPKRP